MATVRVVITDRPGGVTVVVDASPEIPLLPDGDPDVDSVRFTAAMACGVYAAAQIADSVGESEWRRISKDPDHG